MSKFWSIVTVVIIINALLILCLLNGVEVVIGLGALIIAAEFLGGIILLLFDEYRTLGGGLLAGFGLSILIGASVCGGMIFFN